MTPDSAAALSRYLTTPPSRRSVRSQRQVLSHMAGSWRLREGQRGYELVHNHPNFGECVCKVPLAVVNRLVDLDHICYEDSADKSNVWLTLTLEGTLKHEKDNR